ncbi:MULTISPECIES: hypothetical protein [Streptomyces]|uniref:hypothetical protein n=1 Tax=Streptomyces TaxID=1883 RepID=UPI00226D7246|nr:MULTISPECIES: hypothetical protein [unclassified Streptomyces]MCY0923278.1 hypothetical protein [Streptomyces sp. H27-G5]MCY0943979.1 hypothetical protein [Streptomyces sp. H34-AA3]MCY0956301.1 hypothetical protein [Streptomyces sp. H27-H5]MCZ4082321.1 hypothetical protein [Streptomyces sp. H34-S5]
MPEEARPIITIKVPCGEGESAPHATFTGTTNNLREEIGSFFGLDCKSVTNHTLHELLAEVGQLAKSTEAVISGLGAQVIPQVAAPTPTPPQAAPTGSPSAAILEQISACQTPEELRRLWAANQAAFAETVVMDAWKARGRALQAS